MMKLFLMLLGLSIFSATYAMEKPTSAKSEVQMTYKDIQKTLGIVPTYLKMYPEIGLPAAWEEFKSVQLNTNTALSGKLKDLIGIGIAAQIPSKECIYMGTQFAKLDGATKEEIKEAVAMAAATRHWSTFLNGLQYDETEFKKEANNIISHVKKEMAMAAKNPNMMPVKPMVVFDAKTAYQDIAQTLGSVPMFMRQFPGEAISGAWKMMKTVQLNPMTSLSGKEKELIGLAVSAQIPCKYCAYFHTEAAKLNGASEMEITETLAVASVTRQWSTILHGSEINDNKFRQEINQIIKHIRVQNRKFFGMNSQE